MSREDVDSTILGEGVETIGRKRRGQGAATLQHAMCDG